MRKLFLAVFSIGVMLSCAGSTESREQVYIRVNQVGYLPNDFKSALVLSNKDLSNTYFELIDTRNNKSVFSDKVIINCGKYAGFDFTYKLDFSTYNTAGRYVLKLSSGKSPVFTIGEKIFNDLPDTLLSFFKIQRCGYTNPKNHALCHIADATSLIDGSKVINSKFDVTGGWHDAGDYVKFLNTTAVATYTLLFAYDFDPVKFGFDNNKNGIPDILEEAKIGLDWLLRCYYSSDKLITQVQDLKDHSVGWRMPENDNLQFDRPAFIGIGKNIIGIYSAALALASKIWKEKIKYYEFSDKCLSTATKLYSIRNNVPDIDSSGTKNYTDRDYLGKLALGAYELYNATNKKEYLDDSFLYANKTGPDFWWSWGNLNSLVHYRLAKYDKKFIGYIEQNLNGFSETSSKNIFESGAAPSWGANNTTLGIAFQNILWKKLTGSNKYDKLAALQRDFILGHNPWGISFICNVGSNYVRHLHHQIAYLTGGKLSGGFAAGPIKKEIVDKLKIPYERNDEYRSFQTDDFYYRDDRMDYVTNEPTIVSNATAIFVFGYYSK